jgi:hypothetical protein
MNDNTSTRHTHSDRTSAPGKKPAALILMTISYSTPCGRIFFHHQRNNTKGGKKQMAIDMRVKSGCERTASAITTIKPMMANHEHLVTRVVCCSASGIATLYCAPIGGIPRGGAAMIGPLTGTKVPPVSSVPATGVAMMTAEEECQYIDKLGLVTRLRSQGIPRE